MVLRAWLLVLVACSASQSTTVDAPAGDTAAVIDAAPPSGETRYLAFQIFEGTADPAQPFDTVVDYTPAAKVAAVVDDLIAKIGARGERTRLAFVLGPIAFDHSDAEARQIIDDGFAIARAKHVAVGFHLDDSMFWSKCADLAADPANVEWTDWDGTPSTGLSINWAHPPRRMCFNAPAIRAEVTRRARDVIGAEIVAQLALLPAEDRGLFAGVIAGWETHMGQDIATMDRVGFHALANRGFSPAAPPADVGDEIAAVVHDFIALWASGLADAGIAADHIYTHVAFLSRAQFATLPVPPGVRYEQLVDLAPSSQRPSVAFVATGRPGFSTYPGVGVFDQIDEERAAHGPTGWASAEGTNLIPGEPIGTTGLTMAAYLARSFDHGATLVDLYGWGIGDAANPFRTVAEGPEAIAAYRALLGP